MVQRLVFLIFALAVAFDLAWIAAAPLDWWAVLAGFVGWFVADMLSGIMHFYLDYRPCTAGVGLGALFNYPGERSSPEYQALRRETLARIPPFERVVFDFKTHHPRPLALGRRRFGVLIRSTMLFAALPFALGLAVLYPTVPTPGWLVVGLDVLLVAGTLSQYAHATLHRARNPWFVVVLRRLKLFMTPDAHGIHHATLDRDFSTLCGWSNPLVNLMFRFCRWRRWLDPVGLEPT